MNRVKPLPFEDEELTPNQLLERHHYLGPISRGEVYRDASGILVFANPSSRRLPQDRWVELVRWCILSGIGSAQWMAARRWLTSTQPTITTVISYSDPSVGHTGALYRASGWLWAPTWHRLREPPTGNGEWRKGERQAVKDRWVALLAPDDQRERLLAVNDAGIAKRWPWASYHEPRWKRGHALVHTGGADYQRYLRERNA